MRESRGRSLLQRAGLHFDDGMFARCAALGVGVANVTLHVGAGTFQPVRTDDLSNHRMHAEWVRVPAETVDAIHETRGRGGRVVAVGTTVVRSLETAALSGGLCAFEGETRIFITPDSDSGLWTHWSPISTLPEVDSHHAGQRLCGAGSRVERLPPCCCRPVTSFYSYGDAMFITPAPGARNSL
jgi:S-adenosylmethionine:tRNA ribosyltransferase-isomerase